MSEPKRPRFPAAGAGVASRPPLLRPQRPLHEAAAPRATAPSGLGLDSPRVRGQMVERLRAAGVRDERVLAALASVPRHHFVDSALVTQAYEDTSLPIGHGQTISKPSVVARMLELLFDGALARSLGHLGRTLEIGSGCGYQAALLARLARGVISIERLKPLHDLARERLAPLRAQRDGGDIRLVYGDGRIGHAPNAPYQSIISAAGGDELPNAWLEQLAIGGRLVAPLHDVGGDVQRLVVVDRDERGSHRRVHEAVRFVPLESGLA
jgi:protein-L-isoaspartate(D-aspartate) O-methyltransferase